GDAVTPPGRRYGAGREAEHHRRTGPPGTSHGGEEMNVILDIRNLTRTHCQGEQAVHALRGVDLAVPAGELVAVMGPSGSGKSSLLTCAGGLDHPAAGEVLVDDNDLATLSRNAVAALRRRRIGYVFQDFNLIPALTAA